MSTVGARVEGLGSRSWPRVCQGVFLWTLRVCTLGFWVPKPLNLALIWGPKLSGTNIKGINLKSLSLLGRSGRLDKLTSLTLEPI